MTEMAAFVLTLLTCGVLAAVGTVGIVLMKRVMADGSTSESLVEPVTESEPTPPGRGAV
ncbi:hypothetical protein [Halomarina rubra]|uniref:Uncharacterized protein n=1 Tax=Halomarina rubra TaxID=2071873 RepID=A0ABD6AUC8_9EURY|nr:hypothetical protein [Halomarina rubra]